MTTAKELRAYLSRPWDEVRATKDQHLARIIERDGVDRAFALAALLRDHAAALGVTTNEDARRDDLETVVRIKALLDRASRNLARRKR